MWRSQLRASSGYAIGNIARSAALIILTPYLVNALSPVEYGEWAYLEVVIVLVSMLMVAGLDVALMREYWDLEDEEKRSGLFGTMLIGVTVWGGGPAVALSIASALGLRLFLPGSMEVIPWVFMIGWVESILAAFLALFRIREEVTSFVLLSVGRMVLFMGFAIGLIQAGYGVAGGLAGRFFATLIILIIALVFVIRAHRISLRPDWGILKGGFRYGLPLLPANLASYVLFASDRYFLERLVSLDSVAVYSFAYKAATVLETLITRPFAADWAARRFKIAAGGNPQRQYAHVLVLYFYAAVGFGLLLLAVAPMAYRLFAPAVYWPGLRVLPLILIAYIVFGLSYPLNIGIMLKDRTRYLPIVGWIAAGACLILNLLWIPRYQMLGAAWATLVAYAVWTLGTTWVSLRLYWVPYSLGYAGLVAAVGGVGYAILKLIGNDTPGSASLGSTSLGLSCILLLLLAGGYFILRYVRRPG